MRGLSDIDTRLLDDFQRDFPLVPRPFADIGARIGQSEETVLARLQALRLQGAVARVGATVRPNTVGASTLAAIAAPPDRIEDVAAIVGGEEGVNHSYQREDDWNLWFVATAPDRAALARALDRIRSRTGLDVLDLRLERAFNIDLGFRLKGGPCAMPPDRPADQGVLRHADRALLHQLSQGLDLVPAPFAALATTLGRAEDEVRARIAALAEARLITRFGVIVRHRPLGWTANAMVVWNLPDGRIDAAGEALAREPGVTLCYRRRRVPGIWPFGLYAMVHGQCRAETLAVVDRVRMLAPLAGADHRVLFSTRCFKQAGARIAEAA